MPLLDLPTGHNALHCNFVDNVTTACLVDNANLISGTNVAAMYHSNDYNLDHIFTIKNSNDLFFSK